MKLSELSQGDRAIIQRISTSADIQSRLYSFGVAKGSKLYIEACSIGKQTLAIVVDDTLIGLRTSEAAQIEVKIDNTLL